MLNDIGINVSGNLTLHLNNYGDQHETKSPDYIVVDCTENKLEFTEYGTYSNESGAHDVPYNTLIGTLTFTFTTN